MVTIQFKRSGGFSPITNVSGEVRFKEDSAEVISSDGAYRRTLETEERKQLLNLANARPEETNYQSTPSKARDAFQYDVTVTTADGKMHKLSSPPDGLLKWVKDESNKILQHKMERH